MKRSLLMLCTLFIAVGCGQFTDISLEVNRIGDAQFDAVNGNVVFPVTLLEAKLTFDATNLVENGEETEVLEAQTVYDFFADDKFDAGTITVDQGTTFDEVHMIPGVGDIDGNDLTLRIDFTILLDNVEVNGQVNFALEQEEEQILAAAIDSTGFDALTVTIAFDQETLLNGIDFDAVSNGADFIIEADSGNIDIDEALETIEANLLSSFAFVSAE